MIDSYGSLADAAEGKSADVEKSEGLPMSSDLHSDTEDAGRGKKSDANYVQIIDGFHVVDPGPDIATSKWWSKFFLYCPKFHPEEAKQSMARCKLCKKDVKCVKPQRGNTHTSDNLVSHLKHRHKEEYEELRASTWPPVPPGQLEPLEHPKLLRPDIKFWSKFAKYWVYFDLYDLRHHPERKQIARCKLCSKDINVRSAGRALMDHISKNHEEEYSQSLVHTDAYHKRLLNSLRVGDNPLVETPADKRRRVQSTSLVRSYAKQPAARRKNEGGAGVQQKEWMILWDNARFQLNKLRKELKNEDDEDVKAELEKDILKLRKRKAHYEELLGLEH